MDKDPVSDPFSTPQGGPTREGRARRYQRFARSACFSLPHYVVTFEEVCWNVIVKGLLLRDSNSRMMIDLSGAQLEIEIARCRTVS